MRRRRWRSSASYLSLQGHQLHVQLSEERVGGGGAAGHGHHVLLGQVHAFGGATAGALVVSMLKGLMFPPTQSDLGARDRRLQRGLKRDHLVVYGFDRDAGRT